MSDETPDAKPPRPPSSPTSIAPPGPLHRLGAVLRGRFGGLVAMALLLVILLPSMSLWRRVQSLEADLAAARGAANSAHHSTTYSAAGEAADSEAGVANGDIAVGAGAPHLPRTWHLDPNDAPPTLAAGVGHLLEWTPPQAFEASTDGPKEDDLYRLLLVDADDRGRWSADATGTTAHRLSLPPGALAPGTWRLRVERLAPGTEFQGVIEYPFEVLK